MGFFGRVGGTLGVCGTLVGTGGAVDDGGLLCGIGGAAVAAGFEGLVDGGAGVFVGIFGADGGVIPALLSTCFNLGIPPANMSPN